MIRVALLTSWGDRCGISCYAHHLAQYLKDPSIELEVVTQSIATFATSGRGGYDIVHVNYCGWVMGGFQPQFIQQLKSRGMKVVLTFHDSNPVNSRNPFTELFDRVIVHDPDTTDGFIFIPQGIPICKELAKDGQYLFVGTNGIPQERKNVDKLAQACELVGSKLNALIPESPHADARHLAKQILAWNPGSTPCTDWLPDDEIITRLSSCRVLCYPYRTWTPGPSAAVMMGLAARRPVILSRSTQFTHFKKFEDQFTWIESEGPTVEQIAEAINNASMNVPKLPEEYYWDKCAEKYADVYRDTLK